MVNLYKIIMSDIYSKRRKIHTYEDVYIKQKGYWLEFEFDIPNSTMEGVINRVNNSQTFVKVSISKLSPNSIYLKFIF